MSMCPLFRADCGLYSKRWRFELRAPKCRIQESLWISWRPWRTSRSCRTADWELRTLCASSAPLTCLKMNLPRHRLLQECRAELWLKKSEGHPGRLITVLGSCFCSQSSQLVAGMYPVRRDKAQAFVAIVGEYLPGLGILLHEARNTRTSVFSCRDTQKAAYS